MPRDLLMKWDRDRGRESARDLAVHSMAAPPTILNVSHAESALSADGLEPHCIDGFCVYLGDRGTLARMLNARRDVWVQDSAAGEAVRAIGAIGAERIVDVCAGRGTKTRQLRATFPGASIIASDTDGARLAQLSEVFARDERVAVVDAGSLPVSCNGRADIALLDVPCSNTGVLPRRVEARHRYSPEQSQRLVDIQVGIIKQSLNLVRPGGWVLYSTCSIEPEENEELVNLACDRFGLRLESMRRTMPSGKPGEPPHLYRDGSFWALLQRA
jgi:16S rRNA (cytosine967-C5)-methyltransferase